jgi:hypothetical protein
LYKECHGTDKVDQIITIVQELAGSRFLNLIVALGVADPVSLNPNPAFQVDQSGSGSRVLKTKNKNKNIGRSL